MANKTLFGINPKEDWRTQMRQASQAYESGEMTYPEFMFEGLAQGARALVPTPVSDALSSVVNSTYIPEALGIAMQTPGNQAAMGRLQSIDEALTSAAPDAYPRAKRLFGNVGTAFESIYAPTRALAGAKSGMHMFASNTPNALKFDDADFYLGLEKAKEQIVAENPTKYASVSAVPDAVAKRRQLSSRTSAMYQGFKDSFQNTLQQLTNPQLIAEWERGVSKKMKDVATDPTKTQQQQWGQAAYTNLIDRQYGNRGEVFKQLDDEYFTHQGVYNKKELQEATGLADDEVGPIFRTIDANQPVDKNTIMVVRQPTARESSGDMINEAMNQTRTGRALKNIFPMKEGFANSDELLRLYTQGRGNRGKDLTPDQIEGIQLAFIDNPKLRKITDPVEFTDELTTTLKDVKRYAKDIEVSTSVKNIVNMALKNKERVPLANNKQLGELLQKRLIDTSDDKVKIFRNSDQTDIPEAERDIYLMDTYDSAAYELGGVNIIYRVSPNGQVSAIINDVNDIGFNPKIPSYKVKGVDVGKGAQKALDKVANMGAPLGDKLVVVTPPIRANMLTGSATVSKGGLPEASKGLDKVLQDVRTDAPVTTGNKMQAVENIATGTALLPDVEVEDPFAYDPELFGTQPLTP